MKTVILCGGFGTRIRDVSEDIPKPMIPIGGLPIVWHIMKYYAYWGQKDFILCLGYKGDVIKNFFLNYETNTRDFTIQLGEKSGITYHTSSPESDWSVTLADTGATAMTGARVKAIKKYIGNDEYFMLTYGDGVGDIDIDKLIQFHKSHKRICTVTGVRPPGRFGELTVSDSGIVEGFNEKPQVAGGRINGGYFVCSREFFDYLGDSNDLVLEKDPMDHLVKNKQLMVFEHDGFWQPMDTAREYSLLNELYKKNQAPWKVW